MEHEGNRDGEVGDEAFRRLLRLHGEARRAKRSLLVFVHSRWGGAADALVRPWRRHLLESRETLFETRCRPGSGTYGGLREIVSPWLRSIEDLGLMDQELGVLVQRVGPSLGLAAAAEGGGRSGGGGTQLQFFENLSRLFLGMADRLPASLLLQDVQRADSATRVALRYLCDNVFSDALGRFAPTGLAPRRFRGSVVLCARGALEDLLPEQAGEAEREEVHVLSLREVEEVSFRQALLGEEVVERLMRAAGGRVENLPELLELLPEGVEELLGRRFADLAQAERDVLEVLAVLGTPARPDFLIRVAEQAASPPSFTALAEEQLIARQVSRGELLIDFPTPESREVVYTRIPPERRAELHGRVAAVLEERSRLGESVDIESIAHHYLRSDMGEKAVHYALDAAERLHISFAWQRAAEILNTILSSASLGDRRGAVLERLTALLMAMGDNEGALRRNAERLPLAAPAERAAIHQRHGRILTELGSYDEALTWFGEAEAALADVPEAERDFEALNLAGARAEALYGKGEYEEVVRLVEEALAAVGDDADPPRLRQRIQLANTLGKVHLFLGNHDEALTCFRGNHRLATAHEWPDEEVRALFNQATIALQRRDFDNAERMFQECVAFGEETANPLTRAFCLLNLAVVYHRTLRYQEALEAYLRSMGIFRQSGNELQFAVTAMNLGALYQTLGDRERALALLRIAIDISARRDMKYFLGRAWHLMGLLHLEAEAWQEANPALERAEGALSRTGTRTYLDRIRIARARAAHGLGNTLLRDRFLKECAPEGEGDEARDTRAEKALWQGVFHLGEGRLEAATESLETALLSFEEAEVHEQIWLARLHLAQVREALDDRRGARSLLQSASDLIEHIAQELPGPLRESYRAAPLRGRVAERLKALVAKESGAAAEAGPELALPPEGPEQRRWRHRYAQIVGEDVRLLQLFRIIDRVSPSDSSVLIQGESGTGKELIAEAIHERSPRAGAPFIKVNCAAFVESLLLSELFGHERGAFTGALSRKKGRFELAQGGTLFLDEIGDISPNTQVALLRVLQERTFERVGGSESVLADVRIICATNRNLEEMVRKGSFRLDLYYRLKGVVLELPALRERRADIPLLVGHFCRVLSPEGGTPKRFAPEAMAFLVRYSWPGNIRELENFLRSMLLFVDGPQVELANILQFEDFFADGEFIDEAPPFRMPGEGDAAGAGDASGAGVARTTNGVRKGARVSAAGGSLGAGARAGTGVAAGADAAAEGAGREGTSFATPAAGESEALVEGRIADWAIDEGVGLPELKRRLEHSLIRSALERSGGNVTRAAELLEMKRPRLSQIINASEELETLKRTLSDAASREPSAD